MGNPLFKKPENISWNPAALEPPPMPSIQGGEDSMSATISAALPMLAAEMAASMSTLQAKETMFSSKVIDAQSAYQNADDAGGQSVGDMIGQIGQIGQMAQQAAGAAGKGGGGEGGGGVFGQLMEQAMKAVQGAAGGGSGDEAAGAAEQGQPGTAVPGGAPAGPANTADGQKSEPPRGGGQQAASPQPDERAREQGRPTERAPLEQPPAAAAGPGDRQHAAGSAPVQPAPAPPAPSPRGPRQDVSRDM